MCYAIVLLQLLFNPEIPANAIDGASSIPLISVIEKCCPAESQLVAMVQRIVLVRLELLFIQVGIVRAS